MSIPLDWCEDGGVVKLEVALIIEKRIVGS
jgi:hypothetical protein